MKKSFWGLIFPKRMIHIRKNGRENLFFRKSKMGVLIVRMWTLGSSLSAKVVAIRIARTVVDDSVEIEVKVVWMEFVKKCNTRTHGYFRSHRSLESRSLESIVMSRDIARYRNKATPKQKRPAKCIWKTNKLGRSLSRRGHTFGIPSSATLSWSTEGRDDCPHPYWMKPNDW